VRWWKTLPLGAVALGGLVWVNGFASSLPSSSNTLGAGGAGVAKCQSSAITVTQTLSGSNVASVTVAGLSSTCGNGALTAAVDNLTSSSSGSATIPSGGGSVTVTIATAVPAKDVERIDVSIAGP
jgi:hypothetical protein